MTKKNEVVKDITLSEIHNFDDFLKSYYLSGGFTAKKLGVAFDILKQMVKDSSCVKFLSFPACIIATGTRGVINELVKRKLIDVIITTCGTIDHDIARTYENYYHGDFLMDDERLKKKNIHRLGNVLVPMKSYGKTVEKITIKFLRNQLSVLSGHGSEGLSLRALLYEFGKYINNKNSLLYNAYKNNIPIYVPGPFDGSFGMQLWMFHNMYKEFTLDFFKDEDELADIIFKSKRTGALMIGGGISKHHTIWWNQFREGLNYAVYLTTAQEFDGSLSGARLREAISWAKVHPKAKYITVDGDATVTLPLLIKALIEVVTSDE